MNRSITPLWRLEERLRELSEAANVLSKRRRRDPEALSTQGRQSTHKWGDTHVHGSRLGGWSLVAQDRLAHLKLEAALLQSAESPLIQRKEASQAARAKRLAEARQIAEAQLEKARRQRELEELRASRVKRDASRVQQERASSESRFPSAAPQGLEEDWQLSIEYTQDLGSEIPRDAALYEESSAYDEHALTITPDDSVFVDPAELVKRAATRGSVAPERSDPPISRVELPQVKREQITVPPAAPTPLPGRTFDIRLVRIALRGLLPAKHRNPDVHEVREVRRRARVIDSPPWSEHVEVIWSNINHQQIQDEIRGHESLSLAPRAFKPASPLPKRTVELRLSDSERALLSRDLHEDPGETLNLSDFEEHESLSSSPDERAESTDRELIELDRSYRALEEQVEELSFDDEPRLLDASLYDEFEREFEDEPSFSSIDRSPVPLTSDTPAPLLAEPELEEDTELSFEDPFETLDPITFDREVFGEEFGWSGDTPTNRFDGENTPTDVFERDARSRRGDTDSARPARDDEHPTDRRGLLSRFFGRR